VDWLLADVERASGSRLRALVPALAEHVGCVPPLPQGKPTGRANLVICRDQSSLAGMRREWQRSAYFKHVPFKGAGEPMRRHSPPPWSRESAERARAQRRGSDILFEPPGGGDDDSPPAPPWDARAAPWRESMSRSSESDGSVQ